MPKKKVEERPVDTQDTLSDVLDRTKTVFLEGHPADLEDGSLDLDEDAPGDKPAGDAKTTTDDIPPDDAVTNKDKDTAGEPDPNKEKPLKYKTHEEAEKAYQEAERRMHDATTDTKRYRDQVDQLQSQLNTLLIGKVQADQTTTVTTKQEKKVRDHVKEMLGEIGKLDPAEDGYDDKVADAWEKLLTPFQSELLDQAKKETQAVMTEKDKERESARERDDALEKAEKMAKKAGLDMTGEPGGAENSAEYDLFWRFAQVAPGKTPDEQIGWAIKETQRITKKVGEPIVDARKKANERQKANAPLERHSSGRAPDSDGPAKAMSLGEALGSLNRRI
jgi:hypothetical protein